MAEDNKPNDDKPADDKSGDKGKSGGDKGKAPSEAEKTYTQAELDAALADDRRDRKRTSEAKAKPAAKKEKGGDDDDDQANQLAAERKRREELETKMRVRDAQDAVVAAAKTAGFNNPEKIYRLVKEDLSFSDDGKPDNVKDLIALAKRDFPEELAAKGKGSADGGAGGSTTDKGGADSGMNAFIRRAAGRG